MTNYIALPGIPKTEITPEIIIKEVTSYFDVMPKTIKQKNRRAPVALARQIVAFLLRNHFDMKLTAIGELLNRDHTTIIYSTRLVQEQLNLPYDNEYKDCFEWLKIKGIPIRPGKQQSITINPRRISEVFEGKFERVKGVYSNRQF